MPIAPATSASTPSASRRYEVGRGLLPVPGAGNYAWARFLSASELPHSFNPAAGFVADGKPQNDSRALSLQGRLRVGAALSLERIRSVIESARQVRHKLTIADLEAAAKTSFHTCSRAANLVDRSPARHSCADGFPAMGRRARARIPDAALYEVWLRQICRALAKRFSEKHPSVTRG